MLTRIRRLPSPAFVISIVALIVAVGGGSFALAISDKRSDKRIAKKVANTQITKRAPGLSVKHAHSADTIPGLKFVPINLQNGWTRFNTFYRAPKYAVDAQAWCISRV